LSLISLWLAKALQKCKKNPPVRLTWRQQTFSSKKTPKWGLAGRSLDQDSTKNAWEGVTRSLIAVDFAAAFRSWPDRCKKCVRLGGKFVKKS
jgi:hypothetical protein